MGKLTRISQARSLHLGFSIKQASFDALRIAQIDMWDFRNVDTCHRLMNALGPAYNELGYNEHATRTSNFCLRKEHFGLTSIFKSSAATGYLKYHLQCVIFLRIL